MNENIKELIEFHGIRGLLNIIANVCENMESIPYDTEYDADENDKTVEGDDIQTLVNNLRESMF